MSSDNNPNKDKPTLPASSSSPPPTPPPSPPPPPPYPQAVRERGYWKMGDEEYYSTYRNASAAWYLLPIFIGIIGGIIMWLALRHEDPRKAKKGLIVGIIMMVIGFVIWFLLLGAIGAAALPTTPTYYYPT
jgi:hypothetical protein